MIIFSKSIKEKIRRNIEGKFTRKLNNIIERINVEELIKEIQEYYSDKVEYYFPLFTNKYYGYELVGVFDFLRKKFSLNRKEAILLLLYIMTVEGVYAKLGCYGYFGRMSKYMKYMKELGVVKYFIDEVYHSIYDAVWLYYYGKRYKNK